MLGLFVALAGLIAAASMLTHPRTNAKASPQHSDALPDEKTVFATYAGSASCRDCHEEAYELWTNSNHGLAERVLQDAWDKSAFEPPRGIRHASQTSEVALVNGHYQVTTLGAGGRRESFKIERVIGHDPLRQFLVAAPGGRLQTLEVSFDPHSNQWFNVFGEEDRQAGEWGHWTGRGMNWNQMCAVCHNTRVRKNYDAANDTYRTTMAEMSVGCEACHGPLKAHVDWQKQFGKSGAKDKTIPKLNRTRVIDYCGTCHARRGELTGDFKPGDDFLDHHDLVMVGATDHYYPDGQVREEDYEYASFVSSRMYAAGVSCVDCHPPHSLKPLLPGNWLCLRCHNGSETNAPMIDPVAHSHHKVHGFSATGQLVDGDLVNYKPKEIAETGGECVNCHMPQTPYMQRHWRHDHGFTIPDPLLSKSFGIPNACNRCHLDKSVDWALEATERWYGERMNRPDRPRRKRAQSFARAHAGEAAAIDPLIELIRSDEQPYWKAAAASLLELWSTEPRVMESLLQNLDHTNALVRAKSIQALDYVAQGAESKVREALQLRLNDPVRSVRVAAAWALRTDFKGDSLAACELDHFLNLNADQPAGQVQLGVFAFARNLLDESLAHYRKAVEWDGFSPSIRHELAVVLSALNRPREAVAELQIACRLAPREAEYRFKLGLALNESGDAAQALVAFEEAVRLAPQHARAWYNLGLAREMSGETQTSLEALRRAESAAPNDPRPPYARATILARRGDIEGARAAARRALEIQPGFPSAQELLTRLSNL